MRYNGTETTLYAGGRSDNVSVTLAGAPSWAQLLLQRLMADRPLSDRRRYGGRITVAIAVRVVRDRLRDERCRRVLVAIGRGRRKKRECPRLVSDTKCVIAWRPGPRRYCRTVRRIIGAALLVDVVLRNYSRVREGPLHEVIRDEWRGDVVWKREQPPRR